MHLSVVLLGLLFGAMRGTHAVRSLERGGEWIELRTRQAWYADGPSIFHTKPTPQVFVDDGVAPGTPTITKNNYNWFSTWGGSDYVYAGNTIESIDPQNPVITSWAFYLNREAGEVNSQGTTFIPISACASIRCHARLYQSHP